MAERGVAVADIEFSVEAGVGTILLNRPAHKNAFTMEMIDAWAQMLQQARTDRTVGIIVVRGAGDAFCAGIDLDHLEALHLMPLDWKALLTERIHQIALTLENFGKPVIAAVNGPAVGAGLDMALMCDMRFAARSARFAESYVRLGLVPGDGGCFYLPRLVGVARALELLLTGDVIEAIEAERIGMVNRVYDDDQLLTAVYEFATRLAAGPPLVLKMIKQAVYESMRTDLRTSLDLISSHMVVVQSSYDGQEAMAAFREKRTPVFEGR